MGGKHRNLAPTLHAQAWAGAAFPGETSDPSPKTERGGSPCGGRAVDDPPSKEETAQHQDVGSASLLSIAVIQVLGPLRPRFKPCPGCLRAP